jgi:hypothetical protein
MNGMLRSGGNVIATVEKARVDEERGCVSVDESLAHKWRRAEGGHGQ